MSSHNTPCAIARQPGTSQDAAGGSLHAKSAFRTGPDRNVDKPYSPQAKGAFLI